MWVNYSKRSILLTFYHTVKSFNKIKSHSVKLNGQRSFIRKIPNTLVLPNFCVKKSVDCLLNGINTHFRNMNFFFMGSDKNSIIWWMFVIFNSFTIYKSPLNRKSDVKPAKFCSINMYNYLCLYMCMCVTYFVFWT